MSISVIIPYYNESETILTTLVSLACQTYKPDEVLLMDSGSSDKTSVLIDQWIMNSGMTNYKNIYYSTQKLNGYYVIKTRTAGD